MRTPHDPQSTQRLGGERSGPARPSKPAHVPLTADGTLSVGLVHAAGMTTSMRSASAAMGTRSKSRLSAPAPAAAPRADAASCTGARFVLDPLGPFSLREAAMFGFGHRHEEAFDGSM